MEGDAELDSRAKEQAGPDSRTDSPATPAERRAEALGLLVVLLLVFLSPVIYDLARRFAR